MNRRLFIAQAIGTFLFAGPIKCPQNDAPISDIVQAARSFAVAVVSLSVTDRIIEILTTDQTVSNPNARKIYEASERILRGLDRARDTINSGVWDSREIDRLMDSVLAEASAFSSELGFKNPASAARFREYLALLRFGIASSAQIIKKLKPGAPPATPLLDEDSKRAVTPTITPDQASEILIASIEAARKIVRIRGANAAVAWKIAADESKDLHAANKLRLQ